MQVIIRAPQGFDLACIQHRRVLPTSSEDGLIECVPSVALARVLADHKTINRFFAINNADPAGELPDDEVWRYLVCLKYWTLNLRPLMVYLE